MLAVSLLCLSEIGYNSFICATLSRLFLFLYGYPVFGRYDFQSFWVKGFPKRKHRILFYKIRNSFLSKKMGKPSGPPISVNSILTGEV
jgi:hypothetical protein